MSAPFCLPRRRRRIVVDHLLRRIDDRAEARRRIVAAVAPAIVARARFAIREHRVRLVDLAELLAVVLGVDVGMVLARELAERALDVGLARVLA